MTLPPHSLMMRLTPSNCPGLSSSAMRSWVLRPVLTSPRVMTRERMFTSTLPPERMQTVCLPAMGSLPNMAAATLTAPAPSVTSFSFSISAKIAVAISSSLTVTTSSTYLRIMARVVSPGRLTAMPSAKVATRSSVTQTPSWQLRATAAARSACTP